MAALAIPGVTPAESRLRATCLTPGSVTDLVDVGEKIGTGGFSVVRAGTVRATGERVAVKVILPSHYSTGPQRMAALHEAMVLRKLAALNSPHILRLHSAHEDRSPSTGQLRLSLCTELVEGGELFEEICALEHFSEASASRLICRIAETLRLVHAAGVVHRDLKPENVLLRSRSDAAEPVLADFGLSLLAGEQDCARDLVGTHAYMAPEIVTSKQYSAVLSCTPPSPGSVPGLSLGLSVPANARATVRVPFPANTSAATLSVAEGGVAVFRGGAFVPGVAGVVAAAMNEADDVPPGQKTVDIEVLAGDYAFESFT
jgi:serine/threonine protein kinase